MAVVQGIIVLFKKILKVGYCIDYLNSFNVKKLLIFSFIFLGSITETDVSLSKISSTCISVRRITQEAPIKNNVVIKKETISGSHLTCTRKSVHRVERISSKMLLQLQLQQQSISQQHEEQTFNQGQVFGNSLVDDEEYNSDDVFDPEKADLKLLKLAKVIIFIPVIYSLKYK